MLRQKELIEQRNKGSYLAFSSFQKPTGIRCISHVSVPNPKRGLTLAAKTENPSRNIIKFFDLLNTLLRNNQKILEITWFPGCLSQGGMK